MEVSDQLHAPAAFPQGKRPWYPLDRRLGGPQSRSGRGGEEKNSQPPPNTEIYEKLKPDCIIEGITTYRKGLKDHLLGTVKWGGGRQMTSSICDVLFYMKILHVNPHIDGHI
jgi:hypothetical protein